MIEEMIQSYQDSDYGQLKVLYGHTEWYGGNFDEARDGRERLQAIITNNPEAILVYKHGKAVIGTISIIEDGRVAMLYRFVVPPAEGKITKKLYDAALSTLRRRGHTEVLVYSAPDSPVLDNRYLDLGMTKGGSFRCFWATL